MLSVSLTHSRWHLAEGVASHKHPNSPLNTRIQGLCHNERLHLEGML